MALVNFQDKILFEMPEIYRYMVFLLEKIFSPFHFYIFITIDNAKESRQKGKREL